MESVNDFEQNETGINGTKINLDVPVSPWLCFNSMNSQSTGSVYEA